MARALSVDLRERVVARHEAGESTRSVASLFGVAPSTVSKWSKLRRETGSVRPAKIGGYRPRLLAPHRETVHGLVAQKPHRSLRKLRDELAALGIKVSEERCGRFSTPSG